MGVRYEWADDSHLIMNVFVEFPWSWGEYVKLTDELMPILRDAGHPCATIVDTSKMGSLARDGNPMQNLLHAEKTIPDNVFASVIVGAPFGISIFMNMLMKIRPRAQRMAIFTNSTEEAHQKIMERYQSQFPDRVNQASLLDEAD